MTWLINRDGASIYLKKLLSADVRSQTLIKQKGKAKYA